MSGLPREQMWATLFGTANRALVSVEFMKRIGPDLGVVVMVVLSCTWSAGWSHGTKPHAPIHRESKRASETAREAPQPCRDVAPTIDSAEGAVGWDPVSCWDCETAGDPVVAFLAGLIVTTPLCLAIIRSRTRRGEARAGRRMLQL